MNTKKDLYFEMVDNLLVLMNNAKQMGYDLNIEIGRASCRERV